jgi:hypothetical protein
VPCGAPRPPSARASTAAAAARGSGSRAAAGRVGSSCSGTAQASRGLASADEPAAAATGRCCWPPRPACAPAARSRRSGPRSRVRSPARPPAPHSPDAAHRPTLSSGVRRAQPLPAAGRAHPAVPAAAVPAALPCPPSYASPTPPAAVLTAAV